MNTTPTVDSQISVPVVAVTNLSISTQINFILVSRVCHSAVSKNCSDIDETWKCRFA